MSRSFKQAATQHVPTGVSVDLPVLHGLRQRARFVAPALRQIRVARADGPRASRARSRGMEYAESRVYMPGDDVRHMDWRVTARSVHAHTKVFHESRSRNVMLVVDLSDSMRFGSRSAFKSVVAAHAAMLLAWASVEAEDRVGAVICAATAAQLPPAIGAGPVRELARRLVPAVAGAPPGSAPDPYSAAGLHGALTKARELLRGPGLMAVISDVHGVDEVVQQQLAELSMRRDVLLCLVVDAMEMEPPPPGSYPVSDGTSRAVLDTRQAGVRGAIREHFDARVKQLIDLARESPMRCIAIGTGADVAQALGTCVGVEEARARFARP